MPANFFNSSIGKKMTMAVTGLILFLFVVVHMIGNLQIFLGQEALNAYAEMLQHLGEFLWAARAVLFVSLVTHIYLASRLTWENAHARPQQYVFKDTVQASYASRTMLMSGIIILLFIVYHLLHFTFGLTNPAYYQVIDAKGRHDVYSMAVMSFRQPLIALTYVAAMIPLAMHLGHGIQSLFQSLGINHPKFTPAIRRLSLVIAWLIFVGNSSIPLAAYFGLLKLPGGL